MKKLTWTWKKIVSLLCGFLGIGTLVSCYGVPKMDDDKMSDYSFGYVFGDIDGDGKFEIVKGIKVSVIEKSSLSENGENLNNRIINYTFTDEEGNFYIIFDSEYYEKDLSLLIEDVDGNENGSFKNEIRDFTHYGDIYLQKK